MMHQNNKKVLDWYQQNNFNCDIILDGISSLNELEEYVDCALPIKSLHVPIDYVLYLSDPNNNIWQNKKVTYHFSTIISDNIDWAKVNTPLVVYFTDGSGAENILKQLNKEQLSLISFRFVTPFQSTEDDIKLLYNFLAIYYTKVMNSMPLYDYISWLIGEGNFECPFPITHNGVLNGKDSMPCGMQQRLTIQLNNMGIYLCPALCNIEFNIGQFNLNEARGITATNTPLAIFKDHIRQGVCIGCDNCPMKGVCNKPCFARGYDESLILGSVGKSLQTHEELCALYIKLINFCRNSGYLTQLLSRFSPEFKKYLLSFLEGSTAWQ